MNCFHSARFGDLVYADRDVITLPGGLIGLPRLQRWILLDMERPLPLKWLQSLDDGSFGFPVAEPGYFASDYDFELPEDLVDRLGGGQSADIVAMIITTVHPGGTRLTGNLAAPLVVHAGTRRGAQHVLTDPKWALRQEMDYLRFGLGVGASAASSGVAPARAGLEVLAAAAEDGARQEVPV